MNLNTKEKNQQHQDKEVHEWNTAQKMKFSIKDFFSKCDQIRSFLRKKRLITTPVSRWGNCNKHGTFGMNWR